MFIKLTNASVQFRNKPIVIVKSIIISVFQAEIEVAASDNDNVVTLPTKELVTAVFCKDNGTYHVKESVDEVYEMLN